MDHQDWDTIYIRGNNELKKQKDKDKKNHTIKQPSKEKIFDKKIEEGKLKHKKTTGELGKKIEKQRLKLNMTRKDLAYKINLPVKIIDDIENGKSNYNPQHINKIKRILNINMKK